MPREAWISRALPAVKSWWAFDEHGNPVPREGFTVRAMGELERMRGGACANVVADGMVVGDVRPRRGRSGSAYPHPTGPQ